MSEVNSDAPSLVDAVMLMHQLLLRSLEIQIQVSSVIVQIRDKLNVMESNTNRPESRSDVDALKSLESMLGKATIELAKLNEGANV